MKSNNLSPVVTQDSEQLLKQQMQQTRVAISIKKRVKTKKATSTGILSASVKTLTK
jgi:hypothetical protein